MHNKRTEVVRKILEKFWKEKTLWKVIEKKVEQKKTLKVEIYLKILVDLHKSQESWKREFKVMKDFTKIFFTLREKQV